VEREGEREESAGQVMFPHEVLRLRQPAISHHPWTRYGDTKTSRMAQEEFEEYTAAGVRVGAG
jgi:hypothetical protein